MTTVRTNGADAPNHLIRFNATDRRHFIGGSDARIIMGDDQESLTRLGAKSAAKQSRRTSRTI